MTDHIRRKKRCKKTRDKIRRLAMPRLCVHRSLHHIYAQVIDARGERVLLSASTAEKDIKAQIGTTTGNVKAAAVVGRIIAERAKKAGVHKVAFDRSGFRYHGRVKALADAAREDGLEI